MDLPCSRRSLWLHAGGTNPGSILDPPLRDRVGYSDHDRFRGYFPVHCHSVLQPPCLRFAAAVTGRHARLGTRLFARLCRGRHLRRLSSTRLQGATRTDPYVRISRIRLVWGFLCQGWCITPFLSSFAIPFFCSTRAASIHPSRPHISIAVAHSGGQGRGFFSAAEGLSLYGDFEVKHLFHGILHFLRSSFFVRLGSPFLRPDPHVLDAGARRGCQGRPPLCRCLKSPSFPGRALTAPSTAARWLWSG
jgi:hypothetical protein